MLRFFLMPTKSSFLVVPSACPSPGTPLLWAGELAAGGLTWSSFLTPSCQTKSALGSQGKMQPALLQGWSHSAGICETLRTSCTPPGILFQLSLLQKLLPWVSPSAGDFLSSICTAALLPALASRCHCCSRKRGTPLFLRPKASPGEVAGR